MSDLFSRFEHGTQTRNSTLAQPYKKTKLGQRGLSDIGPSVLNSLGSLNAFKHAVKERFLDLLRRRESNIYNY